MSDKPWNILDTGKRSAEENMRLDGEILSAMSPEDAPLLHFYDWEGDAATYGHFVKIGDFLNLEEAKRRGLTLARRPTGGGIVFHLWDFAFSVAVPSGSSLFSRDTLENYQMVNRLVLSALKKLSAQKSIDLMDQTPSFEDAASGRFCMAAPTIYDVVIGEQKVAGAAQRKRKNGFLHQGTISLMRPPEEYLNALLKPGTEVLSSMRKTILPLLGEKATHADLNEARLALKEIMPITFNEMSHA